MPELEGLVAALPRNDYEWKIGEERGGLVPIAVTYLIGYRNLSGKNPPELTNVDAILESRAQRRQISEPYATPAIVANRKQAYRRGTSGNATDESMISGGKSPERSG